MERPSRQTIPAENKLKNKKQSYNPDQKAEKLNKEQKNLHQNQKNETPEPEHERKAFQYMQDGKILNFQFMSEKRVQCPKCKKEYKNILLHLQKSFAEFQT